MTYQTVRGQLEKLTYDALRTAGVAADAVFFDGIGETPVGPEAAYATVAMSFTDTVEDVVGCEGLEHLQGSLLVNVYTPKEQGSKPGEDIALQVIKAWVSIKPALKTLPGLQQVATRNITGPQTLAPDARPHHVHNISCAWTARVA